MRWFVVEALYMLYSYKDLSVKNGQKTYKDLSFKSTMSDWLLRTLIELQIDRSATALSH